MLGDGGRASARPPDPSGPVYRLRPRMHLDLVKGGWMWIYEVLDGKRLIGVKTVGREARHAPETTTFTLLGRPAGRAIEGRPGRDFATAEEFKAAYEATL